MNEARRERTMRGKKESPTRKLSSPSSSALLALVLFRLANALLIQTAFTPDEFWQGPEVAHWLAFGQGELTWEWLPGARIRGFLHPLIFAALYKVLSFLHLDSGWAIAHGPKLLQAVGAAYCDWFTYRLAQIYWGDVVARWVVVVQCGNWFLFYCLSRPYSNSAEAVLTVACLYLWSPAWTHPKLNGVFKNEPGGASIRSQAGESQILRERYALLLGALCVAIRPTSAALFALVGTIRILQPPFHLGWTVRYLFANVLPIVGGVVFLSCVIDRVVYGEWVFVPLSFLRFNVIDSKSAIFGVQAWHWLLSNGLPVTLGASFPLFVIGLLQSSGRRRLPALLIFWFIVTHSLSPHKEFRFLLPVLPLANLYAGAGLHWLSTRTSFRPLRVVGIFLLLHAPLALYLSCIHQRGPLAVTGLLRRELLYRDKVSSVVDESLSVHFLMPCHSTPFHSHLHIPLLKRKRLTLRALDCSPSARLSVSGSESDKFVADPLRFTQKIYSSWLSSEQLPTYIVAYDTHVEALQKWLQQNSYSEVSRVFHSHFQGDADANENYYAIALLRKQ